MKRPALVLIMLLVIAALNVGDARPGLAEEEDPPLRERVFENPDPGKPHYILAGANASLQYWKTADGAVSQALYLSADGTVSVRTFYDAATGLPRRISDEISGNWLLIQANGADSVDFWFYDRIGAYRNGFAVFEDDGQYYAGEIAGLPIHGGKEITGDLNPTTASWTGSFTLDVDTGDLKASNPVAAEVAELMDDLATDDVLLSGLTVGGMIFLGLIDDSSGDAVAPADTVAFEALVDDKVVEFRFTESDYVASVEFLPAGRFVQTDHSDSYLGNFSYANAGLDTGTITLTFDPNNDPDEYEHVFEVTFTSGSMGTHASTYTEKGKDPAVRSGHFRITDWIVPDGIAIAGAAAFVTGRFVPDVAAANQQKCTGLDNATSRDLCRLAAYFLSHQVEGGPTGFVRHGVDWARDKPAHLRDLIDQGKKALENVTDGLLPDDAIHERNDTESLPLEPPPPVGSSVSGEASGPGGVIVQVAGDITPDGDFAVTGDDDNGLSVVIKGSVENDEGTADTEEVAATFNRPGPSSLRAAMGNVVVAGDTAGDAAAFEWGADSGKVRSVRSTIVLYGNAPVVVRKIKFVRTTRDSPSVTLDLSEYFTEPNGDPMRFTATPGSQEYLDVRVSGSVLSIRPIFHDGTILTWIRVTATDPGGLIAEMTFPIQVAAPPAILWTDPVYEDTPIQSQGRARCGEYVILQPDVYRRQRIWFLQPIDFRHPRILDGLKCPHNFVTFGGCRKTFDWGIYTEFNWCTANAETFPVSCDSDWMSFPESCQNACGEVKLRSIESCREESGVWTTRHALSTEKFRGIIPWLRGKLRSHIESYYDASGSRGDRPREPCYCSAPTGVRG